MNLQQLISLLEELRIKADSRSRSLMVNGREISPEERARSEGYASAYSFCIQELKDLDTAR